MSEPVTSETFAVGQSVHCLEDPRACWTPTSARPWLSFGDPCFVVSIDRRAVDGFDSAIPVTSASRVVLYRRRGLCWTC